MARQTTSLRTYALTRLGLVIPMVLILLTLVFFLMRVAPGDPVSAALGGRLSPKALEERRHAGGYDKPILVQYVDYLGDVVRFDFGHTITDNRPVTDVIVENGAATFELTFAAMLVAVVVGVPLGLIAGRLRDTPVDVGIRLFGIVIYAVPPFFSAFCPALLRAEARLLPTSGRASPIAQFLLSIHTHFFLIDSAIDGDWAAFKDCFLHLILPATTLGLIISGVIIRLVRVNVLQTTAGRLHRGGPRPRRGRALGRLPPRVQERSRPGGHRARPPGRAPPRRARCSPRRRSTGRASASSSSAT